MCEQNAKKPYISAFLVRASWALGPRKLKYMASVVVNARTSTGPILHGNLRTASFLRVIYSFSPMGGGWISSASLILCAMSRASSMLQIASAPSALRNMPNDGCFWICSLVGPCTGAAGKGVAGAARRTALIVAASSSARQRQTNRARHISGVGSVGTST